MILTAMAISGGIYALAGTFAGLLSGVLGIGGGIIVVPCLLFIFYHNPAFPPELTMRMAAGTSLAVMVFTTYASLRTHAKECVIQWEIYHQLCPGIIIGTVCGALLAAQLPTAWLKTFLALFLLSIAIKMLFDLKFIPNQRDFKLRHTKVISFCIGLNSGLLGVGGGTLIIPYLSYCGLELRKIIPIAALCTMTVALLGSLTFIMAGSKEVMLPLYSTGYIYWPAVICLATLSSIFAPIGAKITYAVPVKQLKYGFIFILLISTINLLMK
ncbi:sulfite exporter TauE/SafE family protein [Legionella cardiaca]|uniref:Probable membrane transporter protein n=1 Tax=Legionella cardiaca TaxID=1071983 RepID=A0ABY8ASM4_9GAMM|nr:sulfite exporter TauE/SafE family protein [Legionella cardiaca]WED42781.1 sulfite exporter TauE/SafE family protein [Legionella cardiaca]